MKKFKNYILMLLVPLILLGCVSKGVSEAVEGDTGTTIAVNEKMKILINNNKTDVESLISSYPKDTYLSKMYSILGNIASIFEKGGTSSDLSTLNESLSTNLNNFLLYGTGATWKSVSDLEEVYSAVVSYQSSNTATTEDKTVARKIAGRFKEQILDAIDKKENEQIENNSLQAEYFCEVYYLYQFITYLNQKVSAEFPEHPTYTQTISSFLEDNKLITSGSRNVIYDARKAILENEKYIINYYNASTNLVITSNILSSENKTKLLNIINPMITNYTNYVSSISYTNFNQYDREVYNSILSVDKTNGFLTQSTYIDNTPALVLKVKDMIDKLTAAKDIPSNSGDVLKITEVITKLKNPYERLIYFGSSYESDNKSVISSRAIALAEILQVIYNEPRICSRYAQ